MAELVELDVFGAEVLPMPRLRKLFCLSLILLILTLQLFEVILKLLVRTTVSAEYINTNLIGMVYRRGFSLLGLYDIIYNCHLLFEEVDTSLFV